MKEKRKGRKITPHFTPSTLAINIKEKNEKNVKKKKRRIR